MDHGFPPWILVAPKKVCSASIAVLVRLLDACTSSGEEQKLAGNSLWPVLGGLSDLLMVQWPPTRGSNGHFESPGRRILASKNSLCRHSFRTVWTNTFSFVGEKIAIDHKSGFGQKPWKKNVKCLTHEQKVNLASGFENSSKVMRTSNILFCWLHSLKMKSKWFWWPNSTSWVCIKS